MSEADRFISPAVKADRPAGGRVEWLDFYRGLAVVLMIETHVVNTFLHAAAWEQPWRANLNYLNGLVAPAFLFIAGYAQGLGLERRLATARTIRPRLWKLAGLAAMGYGMHLPLNALVRGEWAEAWRLGTQMDVLVCLAVSLAVLALLERGCGWAVNYGVSLGIAAVLVAAPELVAWSVGPAPLVAVINQTTGSLFPLLPWAAFVFCGFAEGQHAASWRRAMLPVGACAAAVFILGRADLSNVSSAFFFERMGWVLLLVPICATLNARWSPRLLTFSGRESLVMYLAHLAIIELLALTGRNHLGLAATAALYLAVLAASIGVTLGWRRLTAWNADRARRAAHLRGSSAPAA